MKGILLALQFFTAVPIRKELPLGRKEVTCMYMALPLIGAAIGLAMYGVSLLALNVVGISPLLASIFIVLTGIILTGGLHLDGWADTGDAFFSYRDHEKRMEILDDPRLGAFGTMALVLLLIVKIALVNELLQNGAGNAVYFMAIPLLARATMNLYFTTVKLAKDKGIAHFFKEKMESTVVNATSVISASGVLVIVGVVLNSVIIPSVLFIVLAGGLVLYRRWSLKHFGGVTGDLSGAFIEGMEALLWLTIILLL